MKSQVNIIVVVDVIGALSDGTLLNGNLCLMDDGGLQSTGQGTPYLCSIVRPGQTVQWTALAVDLQTPVEIKNITFLGSANGASGPGDHTPVDENLDHYAWTGVMPDFLAPGAVQKYRLELQMYEGDHSVLSIDSPALMCP